MKAASRMRQLGLTFAFGSLVFEGTYSALAKGLTSYLSPVTLLLVSEALTALFVIATIGFLPLTKAIRKMTRKEALAAIVVGLLNSGLAPFLWFTGLTNTSAINASLIISADVFFMLIIGYVLLGERMSRMQAIGATIVIGGVAFINLGGTLENGLQFRSGDLLILSAVGFFALGTVLFKKYLTHIHPETALFVRNMSGFITVGTIAIFMGFHVGPEVASFPREKIFSLLIFAFFTRYLNLTFLYGALDRLPAINVGMILSASPLTGVIFAALILGEPVYSYHLLGAIFIVFGMALEHISADIPGSLLGKLQRFRVNTQR